MPRPVTRLSAAQARRTALAAQGFADRRPSGVPDRRALRRVLGRTGLFQIDSVNVLARAHYLPLFSRLGPYPVDLLERAAYTRPRELFEYWGHEASLLPVDAHPLLRWRMEEATTQSWGGTMSVAQQHPAFVDEVLAEIRRSGPVSAGDLEHLHQVDHHRGGGPWWDWSLVKQACEHLFWAGAITTHSRRVFERVYDIPERVIPASVLAVPTPSREAAQRELLLRAARSHGVATERDLRDYYRLDATESKARLGELVEDRSLLPVTVEGWRQTAYVLPDLAVPRRVDARALLVAFDPLVWERERTERLFGFRYRIEIYVPAPKRVHGYYVLPFLLGDRLVGRVDLKSDRSGSALLVQGSYAEPDAPPSTAGELAAELRSMASWLGLERVVVAPRGDLAAALSRLL